MTERLELYKCNICGNLVEVILPGVGELVCCGEPMEYLEAKKTILNMAKNMFLYFLQQMKREKKSGLVLFCTQ